MLAPRLLKSTIYDFLWMSGFEPSVPNNFRVKKRLYTVDFLFHFSVTNSNEVVFLSIIYLKYVVVCEVLVRNAPN